MTRRPTLLALHGTTMSGPSMLQTLGPLARALETLGLDLVAPSAPHRLSRAQLDGMVRWARRLYAAAGQRAAKAFGDGHFWKDGDHRDWFDGVSDPGTGRRHYRALEASLAEVSRAVDAQTARGREVVGVLGFSQGGAMAAILTALAARGRGPLAPRKGVSLRCAVMLSAFRPTFDAPELALWPVPEPPPTLLGVGDRDALFPGGSKALAELAAAFAGPLTETRVFEGLDHDTPRMEAHVRAVSDFVRRHTGAA